MPRKQVERLTDKEAEQRAREAIRRSFEMPCKPHKELVGSRLVFVGEIGSVRLMVMAGFPVYADHSTYCVPRLLSRHFGDRRQWQ
jgi:hypothetical protein